MSVSCDVPVTIDDHEVTALIDTGADTSVMSQNLARILNKVSTQWAGTQIRTAGGHLITPMGRCTARVNIRGFTYIGDFVILPECSKDLILGMDFLQANGAIIDLQESRVSFATTQAIANSNYTDRDIALHVADDHITLPPKSSVLTLVRCDMEDDAEGIAEANIHLLLERHICIARGLLQVRNRCSVVLLTNFSNEYRHVPRGTTIAFLREIIDVTDIGTLEIASSQQSELPSLKERIHVNAALPDHQKDRLLSLVNEFAECFSTSSKVRRTSITKHRIITDESARPVRQHPYRVSPVEREAIKQQVKEMLQDDVIQPSTSPWASL